MVKQTDFAEIGNRINKRLDLKNINSRAEYARAVRKVFEDSQFSESLLKFVDNFYEETEAREVIESNQSSAKEAQQKDELKEKAIRFERTRGRGGVQDERFNNQDRRLLTPLNYRVWRHDPGRLDIKGVDTKRPSGKGYATLRPSHISVVGIGNKRDKRLRRNKAQKYYKRS